MAKRKKSVSQRVIGVAASGLPSPARKVITSRYGAPLLVLALVGLAASGFVTIKWENGRPRLTLNQQRTDEAKENLSERRDDRAGGEGQGVLESVRGRLAAGPVSARPTDTIRIASFNIQVLGISKEKNTDAMNVIADVIRRFDIVAIQELRTKDTGFMDRFIRLINQQGGTYQYLVGPRLGRSNSKEQYIFVYDTQTIEVMPNSVFTMEDPSDLLHREPMVALFRARPAGSNQPFTFILVNIHTDPDETKTELDALADVFVAVQQNPWREDDVILLGDLNVDYRKLGQLGRLPNIVYTVHGEPTNTRGSKSYDNIVFNQSATSEFTGQAAVLNLMSEYSLSVDAALKVSDHMPVWAEFSTSEGGSAALVASRPAAPQTAPTSAPTNPVYSAPIPPSQPAAAPTQPAERSGVRGLFNRAGEQVRGILPGGRR